jgi:hypothetical protein
LADLLKAVPTAIEATLEPAGRPTSFHLEQNWPNPFNAETSIRFQLDAPGPIELALYTLTGQKLRTLAQADFPTGKHAISWDGLDAHGHMAASGVYLYRLRTGKQVQTHKLLLLR